MSNHKKNKTFLQTYLVSFSFFFSHIHTHAQKGGAALFSSAMKRSERTGDLVAGVTGLLHLDTITNKPLEREHDRQRVGRSWRWTTLSSASGDVRKYLHDRWCVCRWRDSVLNLHDSRTQRSLLNPDVRQRHRSSVTHRCKVSCSVCLCCICWAPYLLCCTFVFWRSRCATLLFVYRGQCVCGLFFYLCGTCCSKCF